jgi:hypothetical protein
MFAFKKEDSIWFISTAIFAMWIYLQNVPSAGEIIPNSPVLGAIISGMILAWTPWAIAKLLVKSRREPVSPVS